MYQVKGLFSVRTELFAENEHFFKGLVGEYKFKCVKSKEILIMHTFFVQERRKHEYEKNKY